MMPRNIHDQFRILPLISGLIIVLLLVPLSITSGQAPKVKPIKRCNLISSLVLGRREGKTAVWYVELIERYGVDFKLSPKVERRIRRLGKYLGKRGLNELIEAVRKNYRDAPIQVTDRSGRVLVLVDLLLLVNQPTNLDNGFARALDAKLAKSNLTVVLDGEIYKAEAQRFKDQLQKIQQGNQSARDSIPFAVIITGQVTVTELLPSNEIYMAVANGSLKATAVKNGRMIATYHIPETRGYGNTQNEAIRHAISLAGKSIPDDFINTISLNAN